MTFEKISLFDEEDFGLSPAHLCQQD